MRKRYLLTVDIGNTNAHFGLFDDDTLAKKFQVPSALPPAKFLKAVAKHIDISGFDAVIGSVVPKLTAALAGHLRGKHSVKPLLMSHDLPIGIKLLYKSPEKLGVDRIADVVGGFTLYGGPLLIVGFGTALTFEVVNGKGDFLGGAIAPGFKSMFESLNRNTAQLPKVAAGADQPETMGKDTKSSIRFGVEYAVEGAVKEIIKKLKETCGVSTRLKMVATGGDAEHFAARLPFFNYVNPDLTLIGLKEIFERVSRVGG